MSWKFEAANAIAALKLAIIVVVVVQVGAAIPAVSIVLVLEKLRFSQPPKLCNNCSGLAIRQAVKSHQSRPYRSKFCPTKPRMSGQKPECI